LRKRRLLNLRTNSIEEELNPERKIARLQDALSELKNDSNTVLAGQDIPTTTPQSVVSIPFWSDAMCNSGDDAALFWVAATGEESDDFRLMKAILESV